MKMYVFIIGVLVIVVLGTLNIAAEKGRGIVSDRISVIESATEAR